MAERHEREARSPRQLAGGDLMGRIEVGMQEGDGDGAITLGRRGLKLRGQGRFVERAHDGAVGSQPLVGLDHAGIERVRPHDVQREEVGPGLIADQHRIGEALSGHEQGPGASPLQQGVGGDRGPHLDRLDPGRREGLAGLGLQHPAHGLHGRVLIGRRGGKQLQRHLVAHG